jgi:hypothetical protein
MKTQNRPNGTKRKQDNAFNRSVQRRKTESGTGYIRHRHVTQNGTTVVKTAIETGTAPLPTVSLIPVREDDDFEETDPTRDEIPAVNEEAQTQVCSSYVI